MHDLYFDIASEEKNGSLYRISNEKGEISFQYNHSAYDARLDTTRIFETSYKDFDAFWKELISDPEWFYQHPLFVHPEQRAFVRQQLQSVNWDIHPDKKWQESHQRQWKKVLENYPDYYTKGW